MAEAASVTYMFTGNVTQTSQELSFPLVGGEGLSGTLTYNDAIPPVEAITQPAHLLYFQAVTALTVQFHDTVLDPITATIGTAGVNEIARGPTFPPSTDVSLYAPLTGPIVHSSIVAGTSEQFLFPLGFQLHLSQPFPHEIDNPGPPSLSGFLAPPTFRVVFASDQGQLTLTGTLTSLNAVPLPPAFVLFGAGLIVLVSLGRSHASLRGT